MLVRKAEIQDVKELSALWLEYFIELNKDAICQETAIVAARRIIKNIIAEGISVFVIEENRKIIGFITVDTTEERKIKITNIFIKREKRGYGYGKTLIKYVEEKLKDKKDMILEAYIANEKSLRFFISCGFKEMDENIVLKQVLK